ncbi:MAG: hypothetical protein GFH27_549289n374 [Chloroflexi bacterium AL-W]|nr:hypothetical protein [Chloroflexi bacterium AL-N1]NOK67106.1 hypothetical protein [Chloroflexi bacterium AL-N10]NOK74601.1 hypothetical protein [Chloroflexi bacterium AL-N5]NOK81708.1 hypothetical protein [Chloroflexi bacterium AL-W]NOK89178.1 hypothetical protein [Chloroflexi bacterium AL-N15]
MARKVSIIVSRSLTAFVLFGAMFFLQGWSRCNIRRYNAEALLFVTVCSRAAHVAENYYEAVAAGEFSRAFDYIGYYTRSSNPKPAISYEVVEERWVQRMQALQAQGSYVVAVENIEVYTDDGYPMGSTRLFIHHNGVEHPIEQVFHFNRMEHLFDGVWKIALVRSSDQRFARLDLALGGAELIREGE